MGSMKCLIYLAVTCIIGTTTTSTEAPPPTTTLLDDTDTTTPDTPSNTTKQKGTNRILNYGVVAGSSFGVFDFDDDFHPPGYPHPLPGPPHHHLPGPPHHPRPPPPPFRPAPGAILPHHPPFPPHNGIFPSTGSCKYYCPGRWHNQVYCCDNSPSYHGFTCPAVRDKCPGTHYFRHLRTCVEDKNCYPQELCCPDACLNRHVCKARARR